MLKVAVVDVNENAAQQVVDEIRAAGGEALAIGCDVTSSAQVKAAVETVVRISDLIYFALFCHDKTTIALKIHNAFFD